MNTKKVVGFSLIACSFLLLAGCGNKTVEVTDETTPVDETVTTPVDETVTTTDVKTTDANKEECIDLMVYAFKVAQLQALWDTAGMQTWAHKANDLEIKYRAQNKEYEEACNKYLANTADMSFYNEVQTRVKELK